MEFGIRYWMEITCGRSYWAFHGLDLYVSYQCAEEPPQPGGGLVSAEHGALATRLVFFGPRRLVYLQCSCEPRPKGAYQ